MPCINGSALKRQVQKDGPEKATEFFVDLLESKKVRPGEFSLRDLAVAYMGEEWVNDCNPNEKRGRQIVDLQEAAAAAVTYAHFNQITGQIFFSAVAEAYQLEEMPLSKIIPTKPTKIQDMEKIPGISEVGDEFTIIGESDLYPVFGVSQDWHHVAAKQKRGGIVKVTKEAVFGDLTGKLLERCQSIGKFLALNKEKRLVDCVIDENGGAVSAALGGHRYLWKDTSYATYQTSTPWDNVTTSCALVDWTDISEAWQTLIAILDPYTGEPIAQAPKHIVVTPQNVMTAMRIVNATESTTHVGGYATSGNLNEFKAADPMKTLTPGLQVVYSQQIASRAATDTDWWFGDLTKAFAYYENWGITAEEAPKGNSEEFNRDVLHQFKVSEKGCAATEDPRFIAEQRA